MYPKCCGVTIMYLQPEFIFHIGQKTETKPLVGIICFFTVEEDKRSEMRRAPEDLALFKISDHQAHAQGATEQGQNENGQSTMW